VSPDALGNGVIEKLDDARHMVARMTSEAEAAQREIARLRDQFRDVFGAVYIRLDGSVKQGTVYADKNGPMHEVRELYLQPASGYLERRFRLMGQVGKLYVYGEV
jgi:hypothetical protein